MKKILIAVVTAIVSLLLMIPTCAEGNLRVLRVLSNFETINSTEELWDSYSAKGCVYAFQSTESSAELVTVNGDKMVKCTFVGMGNQYTHWRTWTYKEIDSIIRYKPDGIRFYIKTEGNPVNLVPRLDFNSGLFNPARVMVGSTGLSAVDGNGKTITNTGYAISIPANFEGYVYFPFNKSVVSLAAAGSPTLTVNEWEKIDNFVFYAQSPTGSTFSKPTVVYFDDFELYTYRDVSEDAKYVMTEEPLYTVTPIVPHTLLPGQTAQPTKKDQTTQPGQSAQATQTDQTAQTTQAGQTTVTTPPASATQTAGHADQPGAPGSDGNIVVWIIAGAVIIAFIAEVTYLLIKKKKAKPE